MIIRAFLAALAVLALLAGAEARTVVDSAGRTVEVPDRVDRVFASGPPASIVIYALKPDALLGWPRALRGYEKPYIAPAFRELPRPGGSPGAVARPIWSGCWR